MNKILKILNKQQKAQKIIKSTKKMAKPNIKKSLKVRHIEDFLQDMDDFEFGQKQKINLEQHMTPPNIAAELMLHIYHNQNIEQSIVADIGIGTGMLICGLIFIGAEHAIGFQFDQKYIHHTKGVLQEKLQGASFDLVNADIRTINCKPKMVDLVVMNPPFGTKQAGIDMVFMEFAMKICKGNIYSMHKSSTRNYIKKFCLQRGYNMEVLMTVKFPLKKRFNKYHKKDVAFTEVDIIFVSPLEKKQQKKTMQTAQKIKQVQNQTQTDQKQISEKMSELQIKE